MPGADLDLLIDAARGAADIANRYWRTDQQVRDKGGDAGPVSEGDLAVDCFLRERLTAARPDYAWLSEETEDDPAARLAARRVFIVDPIDGTRAYVEGKPTWAHSLALVEDGVPIAAVVHLPQPGKLYAAARRAGATLNGAPIRTGAATLEGARILASRPMFQPDRWQGGLPDISRHFRPSLAYRLCLVADGSFDAMITLRPTWDWDIAAGALILSEAGANITDRLGNPLRFNSPGAASDGAIAAAPGLYDDIMARLDRSA